MNSGDKPDKEPDATWKVRGGTLSFTVNCTMAVHTATNAKTQVRYEDKTIYAKPMLLQTALASDPVIETYEIADGHSVETAIAWRLEAVIKSMPAGIWGYYRCSRFRRSFLILISIDDPSKDPSNGNNNVEDLLNSDDQGIPLMSGVTLKTPPPTLSPDKLPAFNIEDAQIKGLAYTMEIPKDDFSNDKFRPTDPTPGADQWRNVLKAWMMPKWETTTPGARGAFVESWGGALRWDKRALKSISGMPTKLKTQFDNL